MMTPQALDDVREAMQRALADSDADDRAQLLDLVNRMIMDHVKSATPAASASTASTNPSTPADTARWRWSRLCWSKKSPGIVNRRDLVEESARDLSEHKSEQPMMTPRRPEPVAASDLAAVLRVFIPSDQLWLLHQLISVAMCPAPVAGMCVRGMLRYLMRITSRPWASPWGARASSGNGIFGLSRMISNSSASRGQVRASLSAPNRPVGRTGGDPKPRSQQAHRVCVGH